MQPWLYLTLLAGVLGLACTVDDRKLAVLEPDGGTGNAGPGGGAGGDGQDPDMSLGAGGDGVQIAAGALGAACQQATECSGGNCVDGVCCDSPCSDLCAACNTPGSEGTCSAAASDPLCPEANCQGQSSECRPLAGGEAGINCEAVGVCKATAECAATAAPAGTPCQEATGTCDGQGACVVPDKSALGVACADDAECAEGHCVASGAGGARVCCDAACDGVCQACGAAGRCEETPATDARCEAIACPADNACRDYVDGITENLCRAFGQCRTELDCVAAESFTSLRPDAQCACDPATGACTLAAGVTCAADGDCASGTCGQTTEGDRLCCSGACAAGLFCSSTGSGCVQCEGNDVLCDGNVQRTCDAGALVTETCANGCTPDVGCNDLPPVGFACSAGECAGTGVCQQDSGGEARCCVRDCAAEGKLCSPSGSCDCPPGQVAAGDGCLLQAGDPCQGPGQCQTALTCVDGVCCQEACSGYCERCQAGTGLCAAVPAGQQELDTVSGNSCSNGFECTGARDGCAARTGQPCTDASGCISGACEPTVGGGALVCCSEACGAGLSCRSTGQGCALCESAAQCGNGCDVVQGTCNPLRAAGDTCTVAGQCSTNACVSASDGGSRCCAGCQPGQQCTPQGTCVDPQSEPGGDCEVSSDCRVGVCAPNGVCCEEACDPVCETCNRSGQCVSNGACPAVDCGGGSCTIANGDVCCVRGLPRPGLDQGGNVSFSCEPGAGCVDLNLGEANQVTARPLSCDSPDDCRGGTVCCHEFPVNGAGRTFCLEAIQCNTGVNLGLLTRQQLCDGPSFAQPDPCNDGFWGESGTELQPGACTVADDISPIRRCNIDLDAL